MAGTAVSAWNTYQAGQAESAAYKDSAKAKERKAQSVMERAQLNSEFTRLEGKVFEGKQVATFASSGIDVGSGIALSAYEDTAKKIERQLDIDFMEAEATRDALMMDADLDRTRAKNASNAGTNAAIGSIASGFMRSY